MRRRTLDPPATVSRNGSPSTPGNRLVTIERSAKSGENLVTKVKRRSRAGRPRMRHSTACRGVALIPSSTTTRLDWTQSRRELPNSRPRVEARNRNRNLCAVTFCTTRPTQWQRRPLADGGRRTGERASFWLGRECDATLRHDQRLFGRTSFTSIEDHPALRARVAHNGGGQMTSVDGGCVTCRISTLRRRLGHEQ